MALSGNVPATGQLRPRGYYPEPRSRGDEARATRPRAGPASTNRAAVLEPEYPPPRLRIEVAPEFEGVYDRQDGGRFAGIAPGLSVTQVFSGVPDAIDILCTGNTAVQFFDQNGVALGPQFEVPINQVYSTLLAARSVTATSVALASNDIAIVGKWLRPLPIAPRTAPAGAPP